MKITSEINPNDFKLEGSDVHEDAIPRISNLVARFSATIQSVGNAVEDLQSKGKFDDGRLKAMMAVVLKIEILADQLGSQAELIEQLRDGSASPGAAGFPEFEDWHS
jgi:hypothetical protein